MFVFFGSGARPGTELGSPPSWARCHRVAWLAVTTGLDCDCFEFVDDGGSAQAGAADEDGLGGGCVDA